MTDIVVRSTAKITIQDWENFEQLTEAVKKNVAESSARIYDQTFSKWTEWCEESGVHPLDFRPTNVVEFLRVGATTASTRQRQLSAIRMLAKMMSLLDFNDRRHEAVYSALKMIRAPKSEGGHERDRRALQPEDVNKILSVWSGHGAIDLRNRALIAVIFATGIRRAEAAALRWQDVHLSDGTVTIRHGKGDKERDISLVGEFAITALSAWRGRLGLSRLYVFCPIAGNVVGPDRPVDPQSIYRAIKHTELISGIKFKPHDARRTLITELLALNAPLADVQAQAGHKQPSTTLRYAYPVDAKHRRKKLKLRYGD